MKADIISEELIKPSLPTPLVLRNYKISSFDQLRNPSYMSIILCFPSNGTNNQSSQRGKLLKESLSKTLTQVYPLAGRYVKENLEVDCNDEGALFVETQVNCMLSEFLDADDKVTQLCDHLVPHILESTTTPLFSIQFNKFTCGGDLIAINCTHRIADGFSLFKFVEWWATVCREGIDKLVDGHPSLDLPSLLPASQTIPDIKIGSRTNNVVTKIFVFNGEAISKLKAMVKAGGKRQLISDTVVVTAVIWRVLIKIAQARHGKLRPCVATHVLNLRGKTALPVPRNAFGNFCNQAIARFVPSNGQSEVELHDLVGLLSDSIGKAYKDMVKVSRSGNDLFASLVDVTKEISDEYNKKEGDIHRFTSVVQFPAYETSDFGWGKPILMGGGLVHVPEEMIYLWGRRDGKAIEAWASMNEDDILLFQQHPDIIASTIQTS
ncbi:hypothetical protein Ddye_010596 [Dipteronia dyeriana]|uniref:Uncharacterized protein n=1 Tax=Dipteronia dyeriana TaxID=168575 RepID=A0AAD9XDM6_9ROSI|nr:hypothetical protein Ddye_010596 [Dipteronia dyeriana]